MWVCIGVLRPYQPWLRLGDLGLVLGMFNQTKILCKSHYENLPQLFSRGKF